MGDDEFFLSSPATLSSAALTSASVSTTVTVARNPLTLDEITAFSRQLLGIVFHLYWRVEDPAAEGVVPGVPNLRLEAARERTTKLLQAIHARE